MLLSEIAAWRGEFGGDYTDRNAGGDIEARVLLWGDILGCLGHWPVSILEIGAGSGNNLRALGRTARMPEHVDMARCDPGRIIHVVCPPLSAVEPNPKARSALEGAGFDAFDGTAANPGRSADLVFTSGVLIHVPPDELLTACQGIYDAAERYIVCIEYFAADPEEKPYRGRVLWKRDFGGFWLDNFNLTPLGCGFAWKRMTGLDNLTWTAFSKCA